MSLAEEAERLRRETAVLRATIDVLKRQLAGRAAPPWYARAWRWIIGLGGFIQRRRFARLIAEGDRRVMVTPDDDE